MDAGRVEQALDSGVAQQVLGAEILGQVDEHLTARHLVAMDVADELHLRLHCGGKGVQRPGGCLRGPRKLEGPHGKGSLLLWNRFTLVLAQVSL